MKVYVVMFYDWEDGYIAKIFDSREKAEKYSPNDGYHVVEEHEVEYEELKKKDEWIEKLQYYLNNCHNEIVSLQKKIIELKKK